MEEEKQKTKEKKPEVIPLISIYLKDGEISYSYSEENAEIITENNLLLCGYLEKIKQDLVNIEMEEDEE